MQLPKIIFGSAGIGGVSRVSGDALAFDLLEAAVACGCNAFDSGRVYPGSDAVIGRWLRWRGERDDLILIGKGAHPDDDGSRLQPEDIDADVFATLADMQVDRLDCFLLHRDHPAVPVGRILETLARHIDAGRIDRIGVSNWTFERLLEANEQAPRLGLPPFAMVSLQYSLADCVDVTWEGCRSIAGPAWQAERDWYTQERMPVLCWSALASGFLGGRMTPEEIQEKPDSVLARCYAADRNFARLERLRQLAREKSCSMSQIALAWLLGQAMPCHAIIGTSSIERLRENAQATQIQLSKKECDWLAGSQSTM